MAAARPGARALLANRRLAQVIASHLLAVVAEYAAVVGVLVYAFEQGGARATGLASLAILAPTLVGAPVAAVLTANLRPQLVRRLGLGAQAGGYAAGCAAAAAELPVAVVVMAVVVALGAVSTLRPTGAVLLPAVVRSTSELSVSNLWISYCESASALVGPLAAAGLLALADPSLVLGACAAAAAVALLVALGAHVGPPVGPGPGWRPARAVTDALGTVRSRPWTAGVIAVVGARYTILGALDVLLVVLAFDALDLDASGAGVLNALVGVGAVVSAGVATAVVRRTRLAPWLTVGLSASAVLFVVLGLATSVPVAIVVLPALGLGAALIDGLGRMLLQRSADPAVLASVFALVEFVGGVGLLMGSGLAQLLIAVGDVQLALYGVAALLALVLVAAGASVWRADAGADVPVVEMSVLRELPAFAPLPPLQLEEVARTVEHVPVVDGEVVIRQGDPGDRFYAVVSGQFDIVMSGEHIRVAARGLDGGFGEIALLADVPRTATVTARGGGELLAVSRVPYLVAVTGSDTSRAAAWGVIRKMPVEIDLPSDLA